MTPAAEHFDTAVPRRSSLCGDDCLLCPRYTAKDNVAKAQLAALWHRLGWRETVPTPDEMTCGGCSLTKPCAYGLTRCAAKRGAASCCSCADFPCERIEEMLRCSDEGQKRVKQLCSAAEYASLEQAFFHKRRNLGL